MKSRRTRCSRGAGRLLQDAGLHPDVLYTSVLTRAIQTANIALETADLLWLPVRRSWRLNERHYGALQGKDKAQTRDEFGDEQFMIWRRSYDVPPPPIADDDPYSQAGDARYALLPPELLPRTECLKDVQARLLPYWYDNIVPDLTAGKTVLVTAHGTIESVSGALTRILGWDPERVEHMALADITAESDRPGLRAALAQAAGGATAAHPVVVSVQLLRHDGQRLGPARLLCQWQKDTSRRRRLGAGYDAQQGLPALRL